MKIVCTVCGEIYFSLVSFWQCEDRHRQEKDLGLALAIWETEGGKCGDEGSSNKHALTNIE